MLALPRSFAVIMLRMIDTSRTDEQNLMGGVVRNRHLQRPVAPLAPLDQEVMGTWATYVDF